MRPLLLPGLLDAARHNAAHGRAGVALFESAHVYLPAGRRSSRSPRGLARRRDPADEHHRLAALLTEAGRTAGARRPARPTSMPRRRSWRPCSRAGAAIGSWRVRAAGGRPFLAPGPRGRGRSTAEGVELGWIGELHPLVLREWELQGTVAAFELEVDLLARADAGRVATYSDVTSFPAVLQDIAVIVPEDVPRRAVGRGGARGRRASCWRRCAVFDLYHGEQVGEGSKSLALRLEFRAPDRTLTDEEVAERRAAIEEELESIGGGSVPDRVAVIGAAGYGGAVRRRDPPPASLAGADGGHGAVGRRAPPRRALPALPGAAELEEFDPDAIAERAESAIVAYPHGAAAPAVKALRERGLKVVDLSADFRLDRERYERWYQAHAAPELLDEAVYGLTETHREEIRGAELVAAPGCYSDGRAARAVAAARPDRRTWSWTRSPGSRARAARPPRPPTSCR